MGDRLICGLTVQLLPKAEKMRKVLVTVALLIVGVAFCLPSASDVQKDVIVPEADLSQQGGELKQRITELETQVLGKQGSGTTETRIGELEHALLGKTAGQDGDADSRISGLESAIKKSQDAARKVSEAMKKDSEDMSAAKAVSAKSPMSATAVSQHMSTKRLTGSCNVAEHKCNNDADLECDTDDQCIGVVVRSSSPAPVPAPEPIFARPQSITTPITSEPKCEKTKHKCLNNPEMECDQDSDCGHAIKKAPHVQQVNKDGCDLRSMTCYQDGREACRDDADCVNYKCKKAPSQWIALVLAMSPFAPLGVAFAYISRWGLMALYLNATFLPCLIACILICCFQPKLEDEAYRMPTAVWIMVFWGILQIILYIWAVWIFGENGFDAGGDFEGCLLRDNWHW